MTIESLNRVAPCVQKVAIRSGPPTMDELRVHYPARFTWLQLKTFVSSGYVPFSTVGCTLHPRRNAETLAC